ncbi:hypothetical protein MLD38_012760 [Melastoma candidum]|uniref:Uncharacterized protein n=1 Tax=Melastoma candidum TaxID=119954 RepID=A0ACB9R7Y5_9MYRT|nr:hypothetical protein MLD38_012760 [Melastoma candidum]
MPPKETSELPITKPYTSIVGDENHGLDTIVSWNDRASDRSSDVSELGTYRSASVTVGSDYFCATAITIQNMVVANGSKAVLYRVKSAWDTGSRSWTRRDHTTISSSAYRDRSMSTPQGLPKRRHGVFFRQLCGEWNRVHLLGRAWGDCSRVVYSYSNLDHVINPEFGVTGITLRDKGRCYSASTIAEEWEPIRGDGLPGPNPRVPWKQENSLTGASSAYRL